MRRGREQGRQGTLLSFPLISSISRENGLAFKAFWSSVSKMDTFLNRSFPVFSFRKQVLGLFGGWDGLGGMGTKEAICRRKNQSIFVRLRVVEYESESQDLSTTKISKKHDTFPNWATTSHKK